MKGSHARDTEHKLGVWAGSTGELFFENVEVPAENLVGEEGQGFEIAMYALDQGRFTVAAGRVRRRARLPRALGRVRARAGDVRAGDRQVPVRPGHDREDGARLRDVEAARDAGRVDEERGPRATRARRRSRSGTRPSRRSRRRTSRSRCTARTAIRRENGIERYFRNARAPIIYEGTTQIHKLMQAEHALGYRRLNGGGDVSPMCSWAPALAQSR